MVAVTETSTTSEEGKTGEDDVIARRGRKPGGFRAFLLVWSGQVLSMIGSAMTAFALSIWAYQKTGLATSLALGRRPLLWPWCSLQLGLCVFFGRTPVIWAVGLLASSCLGTMVNGLAQSIWQAKVPPQYQGRVFSARRMIAYTVMPLVMLVAGPLADRVFEPAMRTGGILVPVFSRVTGTGAGAGRLGCAGIPLWRRKTCWRRWIPAFAGMTERHGE
jgi:hypothetical protein